MPSFGEQSQQNECSPVLYDEFLNCNSYVYKMNDCQDSSSISSEAEFRQFKGAQSKSEDDELFVKDVYDSLMQEKLHSQVFDQKMLMNIKNERYIDQELW